MSQAQIGALRVSLGLDTAQFQAGAQKAQSTLGGLTSSLKAFAGGAVAALSLQQVGSAALVAIQRVAQLGDVAENIGITAEEIQNYNRMALASGTTSETMARGLQSIAEQSTTATSALGKLFTANGIQMQGMATNEVIRTFTTLLQNARTPAEQLAIATGVLGDRVGRELVEAMRVGAEGVDASFDAMVASGEFHTNSEVARLQEIETEYNKVTARIATVWQQMVLSMIDNTATLVSSTQSGLEQAATAFDRWKSGLDIFEGMPNDTMELWKKMLGGEPIAFTVPQVSAPGKGDLQTGPSKPTVLVDPNTTKAAAAAVKTITDNTKELGLTIEDLRGPATAFRELEVAADTFGAKMQEVGATIIDGLVTPFMSFVQGTITAADAFEQMKTNLLSSLNDLVSQFLKSGLMSLLNFGGTQFGGAMGFGGFGGFYAEGGRLGAGKWGIAGEAGPEIIHGPANITPMDGGGRGGSNNVIVHNYNGGQVEQKERKNADGGMTTEIFFRKMLDKTLPDANRRAVPGAFGVNPSLINR